MAEVKTGFMPNNFQFEQTCSNGGDLTVRCIRLSITSEDDDMTETELDIINEAVRLLNENYKLPK
jgi:hypothetical protein